MTMFGFRLWGEDETAKIREGQRRIGEVLNGIADDLQEARDRNRKQLGLDAPVKVLTGRKAVEK